MSNIKRALALVLVLLTAFMSLAFAEEDGKIPLTVTGTSLIDKEYDGNRRVYFANFGKLNGVLEGDDVTLTAKGLYAYAGVGSGKAVNVTYSLEGADADKYYLVKEKVVLKGSILPSLDYILMNSVMTDDENREVITDILGTVAFITEFDSRGIPSEPQNVTISKPKELIKLGAHLAEVRMSEKLFLAIDIEKTLESKDDGVITFEISGENISVKCAGAELFTVDTAALPGGAARLVWNGEALKCYDASGNEIK